MIAVNSVHANDSRPIVFLRLKKFNKCLIEVHIICVMRMRIYRVIEIVPSMCMTKSRIYVCRFNVKIEEEKIQSNPS